MPDFIFDQMQDTPEETAAGIYAQTPSTVGEAAEGLFHNLWTQSAVRAATRGILGSQNPTLWEQAISDTMAGGLGPDIQAKPQETISPDATKQYSVDGKPLSDVPISKDLATELGQEQKDKLQSNSAIQRFNSAHSWPVDIGLSLAVDMADPINDASLALGFMAPATLAGEGAGLLARMGGAAGAGAAFGGVTQAATSGAQLAFDPDYQIGDALRDTFYGAAQGAVFATAGAGIGELFHTAARAIGWQSATERYAAMKTAASQMVNGQEIDVEHTFTQTLPPSAPFAVKPPETSTAAGQFMQNPLIGTPQPADIDQLARTIDPGTFDKYDALTTRRNEVQTKLQQAQNSPLARQIIDTHNEIDQLEAQMSRTSRRQQKPLQDRLDSLRETLNSTEAIPDVAKLAAEAQQIDYRMRDLAQPVSTAYRAAQEQVGGATATRYEAAVAAQTTDAARTALNAFANRQKSLHDTGWAPGIAQPELDLYAQHMDSIKPAPEPKAAEVPTLAEWKEEITAQEAKEAPNATASDMERLMSEPAIPETVEPATPYATLPKQPERLAAWIKRNGGLNDATGDVRHIMGGPKARPGLIDAKGMNLDDATLKAWEDGYLPEHGERPPTQALLDALDDDLRGTHPRYAATDSEATEAYRNALQHNQEIDRLSQEFEIDPKGLSRAQFFDAVTSRMSLADMEHRIAGAETEEERLVSALSEHFNHHGGFYDREREEFANQPATGAVGAGARLTERPVSTGLGEGAGEAAERLGGNGVRDEGGNGPQSGADHNPELAGELADAEQWLSEREPGDLTAEEWAELQAADEGVEQANMRARAYMEAASCITEAAGGAAITGAATEEIPF